MIMFLKPLLQAGILAVILKSKYGLSFAAHFPQLSDFSHLHVMEDAEFTHAHWAELYRVLNSSAETKQAEARTEAGSDTAQSSALHHAPEAHARGGLLSALLSEKNAEEVETKVKAIIFSPLSERPESTVAASPSPRIVSKNSPPPSATPKQSVEVTSPERSSLGFFGCGMNIVSCQHCHTMSASPQSQTIDRA